MKWKKDKNDGCRQAKAGIFECIVFQHGVKNNMGWWEYGVLVRDNTFKEGHARTPETCMHQCEMWIAKHIVKMKEDLNK